MRFIRLIYSAKCIGEINQFGGDRRANFSKPDNERKNNDCRQQNQFSRNNKPSFVVPKPFCVECHVRHLLFPLFVVVARISNPDIRPAQLVPALGAGWLGSHQMANPKAALKVRSECSTHDATYTIARSLLFINTR